MVRCDHRRTSSRHQQEIPVHAPAIALAWEFWRRHRFGLSGTVGFVAAFVVVCAVNPLRPELATANSIWFGMGLCYAIGVFAYGFDGKLEAAESGFPARLFVLPVRTSLLVAGPMIQGVFVTVLLWLAWSWFVLRPSGVETPLWAAVLLAAGVAVSQALVWLPFGVPWLRLAVLIAALLGLLRAPAIVALAGGRYADPDMQSTILFILGGSLLPVAFLLAYCGVARARRGDTYTSQRPRRSLASSPSAGWPARPFPSAMRAQLWYEWRARGRAFVLIIAFLLAILASLSAVVERHPDRQTNYGVLFLIIPILVAANYAPVAGTSGTSGLGVRWRSGLSAFAATRPLSNSAFVLAKCRAAGVMTAAAWAFVLVALFLWLAYTGGYRDLERMWGAATAKVGAEKATALGALLLLGPVLLTWRILVAGLWTGLTGRPWVAHAQLVVVAVVVLQGMYEWTTWQADPDRRDRILDALLWVAGGAVAVKLLLAGGALSILRRRREVGARAAVQLLAVWLLATASLFALVVWLTPPEVAPGSGLALGSALAVPLARPLAAPLALAWNRHR
jgi:hypothetical protein